MRQLVWWRRQLLFPNPLQGHQEIHRNTRRHLKGAEGDKQAPEPRRAEAQSSEYHTPTRASQQLRRDAIVERVRPVQKNTVNTSERHQISEGRTQLTTHHPSRRQLLCHAPTSSWNVDVLPGTTTTAHNLWNNASAPRNRKSNDVSDKKQSMTRALSKSKGKYQTPNMRQKLLSESRSNDLREYSLWYGATQP